MKRVLLFIALFGTGVAVKGESPVNQRLESIVDALASLEDYSGDVTYSVLLPQAEDPIVYEIKQRSTATADDPLSPADYLIEWSLNGSDGFSAYFDGNHYRYRDNRLQEYHRDWDSIPLLIGGGGVQQQAQFVDVLPQFIGRDLKRLLSDTMFVYNFKADGVYNGLPADILKGRLVYRGYTSKEMTYVFDPSTGMPRVVEYENNPGAISEQSVTVTFSDVRDEPFGISNEEALIEIYPDVFERFRESNFKVENLPGTLLPSFSAPMLAGDRYTHHRGDGFDSPVIFVVLNDSIENGSATIEAVREAIDKAPTGVDMVMAFTTNNAERAEKVSGAPRPGENILLGARGLARDCGIGVFPTILYIGRDGRVNDVTLGYNKDLVSIVIQKVALM